MFKAIKTLQNPSTLQAADSDLALKQTTKMSAYVSQFTTYSRLLPKHWQISGFNTKTTQLALGDTHQIY